MATDAQGWSSLPADLVNRVADCVRAVCQGWRSSTADPKAGHDAARFHPTRWIVLDELDFDSDTRLFVNATTGRFVRRRLPLLRDYHFVSSTTGCFLVLAEKEPPHAALVLNTFTGSLIHFKAPTPSEAYFSADVVGVAPTLVLVGTSDDDFRFFLADPDSERFDVRLASSGASQSLGYAESEFVLDPVTSALLVLRGLAVELAGFPGEMLRVDRSPQQGVHVFRMDSEGRAVERVSSIGTHALFLGSNRCFSIHADSFPSVKANCFYYDKEDASSRTYYMYDLAHDKEERIAAPNEYYIYPASIIQLLVQFTMCTMRYEPGWDQLVENFTAKTSTMSNETREELLFEFQMEMMDG
ncbi:unnamed protein product [Urochloa humidicola]